MSNVTIAAADLTVEHFAKRLLAVCKRLEACAIRSGSDPEFAAIAVEDDRALANYALREVAARMAPANTGGADV